MTAPASSGGAAHGYSGTPLPRKLGVTPTSRVLLVGMPDGFELGAPHHVRAGAPGYDVQLLFCPDVATLGKRWAPAVERSTERGAVWVAWLKKASGVPTDLTENGVRDHALPLGWVDVKVCAVDATWSALKLVRRLPERLRS
ncbi:DUF3052 domain-containing protein [Pseudonocardia sp.]|jgi:hypothetical protein|uniref:DUF3052 domain-containing protein n=1 Tax=Pseudonocardia sp. TaxID=60912 RepID=UPI002639B851|nr:DUF3052 domain-containing protein [Pseudonocardia sp.]MCW2721320.1 hypothetical protein [Pseudonocardia sp.]MDT7617174.1 hypothetical protein [Pseudonocardiales bacterium]